MAQWIKGEHKLFSKEIEVMYEIPADAVEAYIKSELPENSYQVERIMNELYVEQLSS